jgi:hypothetical protein
MQIDRTRIDISRPPALPGIEAVCVQRSPKLWRLYHESYSSPSRPVFPTPVI